VAYFSGPTYKTSLSSLSPKLLPIPGYKHGQRRRDLLSKWDAIKSAARHLLSTTGDLIAFAAGHRTIRTHYHRKRRERDETSTQAVNGTVLLLRKTGSGEGITQDVCQQSTITRVCLALLILPNAVVRDRHSRGFKQGSSRMRRSKSITRKETFIAVSQ
jgi:hypothetical protein